MLPSRGLRSRLVPVAALALAAATGAVVARAPLSMSDGFEKALNTSRGELTFKPAAHTGDNKPGDEGYWLTRAEMQSPPLFAKPVTVGDRIAIASADGIERKLEVVDVKAIGSAPKAKGTDTVSLMLVTARVVDDGAQEKLVVRFIVEGQMSTKPAQAVSKAL